jgi:tripeptide aminopeptidase
VGDTLITTDGRTLLGADDKAGIAAIMGALEVLLQEPTIERPTVRVCFNPDEEIGRGADCFPLDRFDCPVAFTIDGGFSGEINVETFSADKAVITLTGISTHPGTARGKMVNALAARSPAPSIAIHWPCNRSIPSARRPTSPATSPVPRNSSRWCATAARRT